MSSAVLTSLKTIQERIPDNYTSGQLIEVLDKLLYRAIDPLIRYTKYVDRMLAVVLSWYIQNHRRKITPHSKPRLAAMIMAFLIEKSHRRRLLIYRRMRLERNITFFLVRHWLKIMAAWPSLHIKAVRGESSPDEPTRLLILCCVTDPERTQFVINEATAWVRLAEDFKDRMVEKYMRLVVLETVSYWKTQRDSNQGTTTDVEELAQNFIMAAMKAIDKFDERQGTLTSYIKVWLKSAKIAGNFRGEYGVAFVIPHSRRTSIARGEDSLTRNIGVSLQSEEALSVEDGRNIEDSLHRTQVHAFVRSVAKRCDPVGIGRLLLGIAEDLNPQELALLNSVRAQ